ncbi:MAG: double-strand break repair helicase AddA [Pseudomonadota bacterium]
MNRIVPAPEQVQATRPDRSNWVAANAGAGKTAVLTSRVARLLLAGAPPERILCLTYTKAAAAEMQTRLFRMLGGWAMAPEEALSRDLGDLGATGPVRDRDALAEARRLFARALETPGGLKIQTIHAFCERLLRRFPLEAGVSPSFEVMDDRQTDLLLSDRRIRLAEDAENGRSDAFDRAARRLNEDGIDQLAAAVIAERAQIQDTAVGLALQAQFGLSADADRKEIAKRALQDLDIAEFAALAEVLRRSGGKVEQSIAALVGDWQRALAAPLEIAAALSKHLLTGQGRRPLRGLGTKNVLAERPQADSEFDRLCTWAADLQDQLRRSENAARTEDLYVFGAALIAGLERDKQARGLLDFSDLVTRARRLLTQDHMRSWILYKLDRGIDHILIDEAQDTSPEQWDVIAAIAEEFLSGEGARPADRSIFVVGDEKQSIYSFQGADPKAFGTMRDAFDRSFSALGSELGQPKLETSYRSAPAILDFVDAVFEGDAGQALTSAGDPVNHKAHRKGVRGRVDLWPLVEPEEAPKTADWWEPVDAPTPESPRVRLADDVAAHISDIIGTETLPARGDRPMRLATPADIIVLLTGRMPFAPLIIQGLKARGIPVAGADRLSLVGELAVLDLMALMRITTMPGDDLSLAALLRSPLCGLDEDELFSLAHGRKGTLWQELDQSRRHPEISAFLADMANRADFERPYEFLEHALVNHQGRRKLVARLGPEAEDPIDELLVQSLVFEAQGTPSMAGFLVWLEAGEITVKREMDRGTDAVRVMTVHGAKGLEAPVVILPDTVTAGHPGGGRPSIFPLDGHGNAPGLLVWAGRKDEDDRVTRQARDTAETRAKAERQRLLYVALTRAEDWLILCGARLSNPKPDSWYFTLEAAMDRLAERAAPVSEHPSPTGDGLARRYETGAPVPAADLALVPKDETELAIPDWLSPAAPEPRVERGSPSGLGKGLDVQRGGSDRDPETARRRGSAIHLVMERLPGLPPGQHEVLGARLLAHGFPDLDDAVRRDALDEAIRALGMPEARALWGPDSMAEVSVAIDAPYSGPRMIGRIDRLCVGADTLTIADIKTDAAPPPRPDTTPTAYLAQLGAYAAAIGPAWPGHNLRLVILWTAAPTLMEIPFRAADQAFRAISFARTGRA